MEKLKVLHQQVLPFILRREKDQVLKELPPKSITMIPCDMSPIQMRLYRDFCSGSQAKKSIHTLQRALELKNPEGDVFPSLGSDVLKSLLYLRLLCTHPSLVTTKVERNAEGDDKSYSIDCSGKLMALSELLRNAGIQTQELTAADNDCSLLYCDDDDDVERDDVDYVLEPGPEETAGLINDKPEKYNGSKCLIFAQFTHSLDVVEELLLKRHMPSVRYVRLDGRVPLEKRSDIVDMFNQEEGVRIMLLTTRIGGLGLNLTGKLLYLLSNLLTHPEI
jgi:TATA-binding protein-associated factor